MFAASNLNDEILKAYIEKVFDKYDVDNSGGLDEDELTVFFNDLFKTLNIPGVITKERAREAIISMDEDGNGVIDREELFKAFKMIMSQRAPQPPPPPPQPFNPYAYNSFQCPPLNGGYHNPQNFNQPPPPFSQNQMNNSFANRWGQQSQSPYYPNPMSGSGYRFGGGWSKKK